MKCYEQAINSTSTAVAPWFVIPADDKKVARYIVAKIIWEELQKLTDIKVPELSADVQENVASCIKMLQK